MKNAAKTTEELVKTSINPELFGELLTIIKEETKENGYFFVDRAFSGIGFLEVPYKNSCYDGTTPLISITGQKNTINVYIFKFIDGKSVVELYGAPFGKSNIGKGCIRVKKLTDEKREALREMLRLTVGDRKVAKNKN